MKMSTAIKLIVLIFILVGCGGRITATDDEFPLPDRVKLKCRGTTYTSDAHFIRAMGKGTSRDESTAHRMASLDASAKLARAVEAYREKITGYNNRAQGDSQTVEWENESLTREQLDVTLEDTRTVCSETNYDDQRYTTVVIVETPLSMVKKEINGEK